MLDLPYVNAFNAHIEILALSKTFFDIGRQDVLKGSFGENGYDGDFYADIFFEGMEQAAEFVYADYIEEWEVDKWFVADEAMTRFYKLCKELSRLHGIPFHDNPYVIKAEQFVRETLTFYSGGLDIRFYTGTRHKYASSFVIYIYPEFYANLELIQGLVKVFHFYKTEAVSLQAELYGERMAA